MLMHLHSCIVGFMFVLIEFNLTHFYAPTIGSSGKRPMTCKFPWTSNADGVIHESVVGE